MEKYWKEHPECDDSNKGLKGYFEKYLYKRVFIRIWFMIGAVLLDLFIDCRITDD